MLAIPTVVPATCTGRSLATGVSTPVLPTLKNTCSTDAVLTGWSLIDKWRQNRYRFADGFTIKASGVIRLYSGIGKDAGNAIYWNRKGEVWDNLAPEEAETAFWYALHERESSITPTLQEIMDESSRHRHFGLNE